MRTVLVLLSFLAVVYCQTQNKNGNPTGEIGQPAFDEIVVESTLTVRGKSGSRSGKSLITNPKPIEIAEEETKTRNDGANLSLKRNKRTPEQSQALNQKIEASSAFRDQLDKVFEKPIVYQMGIRST